MRLHALPFFFFFGASFFGRGLAVLAFGRRGWLEVALGLRRNVVFHGPRLCPDGDLGRHHTAEHLVHVGAFQVVLGSTARARHTHDVVFEYCSTSSPTCIFDILYFCLLTRARRAGERRAIVLDRALVRWSADLLTACRAGARRARVPRTRCAGHCRGFSRAL